MVGSFLKDRHDKLVTIDGSPVIQKVLKKSGRKPRECQQCGFERWCVNDTCFVVSRIGSVEQQQQQQQHDHIKDSGGAPPFDFGGGSLEWLCPNCAVTRGLPKEYFRRNKYAQPLKDKYGHRGNDDTNFLCGACGPDTTTSTPTKSSTNTSRKSGMSSSPAKSTGSTSTETSSISSTNGGGGISSNSSSIFDWKNVASNYFCYVQDC